jgi:hypothetical protein
MGWPKAGRYFLYFVFYFTILYVLYKLYFHIHSIFFEKILSLFPSYPATPPAIGSAWHTGISPQAMAATAFPHSCSSAPCAEQRGGTRFPEQL